MNAFSKKNKLTNGKIVYDAGYKTDENIVNLSATGELTDHRNKDCK